MPSRNPDWISDVRRLHSEPEALPPIKPAPPLRRFRRKRIPLWVWITAAALALSLFIGAVLIGLALRSRPKPVPPEPPAVKAPSQPKPQPKEPEPTAAPKAPDPVAAFIARWGQPDTDDSTENDDPRPPFVTRILTYHKAAVRVIFGKTQDKYGWALLGYTDPAAARAITAAEAERRLAARDKAAPKPPPPDPPKPAPDKPKWQPSDPWKQGETWDVNTVLYPDDFKIGQVGYLPPQIGSPLRPGRGGFFFKVDSVLAERTMIVQGFKRVSIPDRRFVLFGISTKGLADGSLLELSQVFKITGTAKVLGQTLFVLQPKPN